MSESQNILFLDIETLPILMRAWTRWEANALSVVEDTRLLSFDAKWKWGRHISMINHQTDEAMIRVLWKLFNRANVIVAQNGDAFDIKKVNARFAFYNLSPPAPYKTVDTLKIARRHFSFSSNKLDDLGKYLGIGSKIHTGGFKLWEDCIKGDKKALRRMMAYNKHDVILLEKIYNRLLPWISNHPNLALGENRPTCPKCKSRRIWSEGYKYRTSVNSYKLLQCQDCKGYMRGALISQEYKPLRNV